MWKIKYIVIVSPDYFSRKTVEVILSEMYNLSQIKRERNLRTYKIEKGVHIRKVLENSIIN